MLFCLLFPQINILICTLSFSAYSAGFIFFKDEIEETPLAIHTAEQIRNLPPTEIPEQLLQILQIFYLICTKLKVAVLCPI